MRMLCVWWCDMKCKIWLVFDWYLIGILKLAISFIFFPNLEMITMNESKYQLESCDFDVYGGDLYDWYLTGIFLWAISYETYIGGALRGNRGKFYVWDPRWTHAPRWTRMCVRAGESEGRQSANAEIVGTRGMPVFAQEYCHSADFPKDIYNLIGVYCG